MLHKLGQCINLSFDHVILHRNQIQIRMQALYPHYFLTLPRFWDGYYLNLANNSMGDILLFNCPFPPVGYHRGTDFFYNLRLGERRAGFIGFPETQSFMGTRLRNKQYMCYDGIVNGSLWTIFNQPCLLLNSVSQKNKK